MHGNLCTLGTTRQLARMAGVGNQYYIFRFVIGNISFQVFLKVIGADSTGGYISRRWRIISQ
jgi:hypothetical protein